MNNRQKQWENDYVAYFNGHKSDFNLASILFVLKFGIISWIKDIVPSYRKGMMFIFKRPPTEKTLFYTRIVSDLARIRLERDTQPLPPNPASV